MKVTYNPFLKRYQLVLGGYEHGVRIGFDSVAASTARKDLIFITYKGVVVADIKGDNVAEFTHELAKAEQQKQAREMGQNSAAIHSSSRRVRRGDLREWQEELNSQIDAERAVG